jgi:hypothetical protein
MKISYVLSNSLAVYAKYDFHNTPSKSSSCSGVKYF